MTPDPRILTEKQKLVFVLDQMGLSPTRIGEQTGLSLARVGNIKCRLKELGFPVTVRRRRSTREELKAFRRESQIWTEPVVTKSEFEPEDDELPDLDEPVMAVERCECGLIKPCHHLPVLNLYGQGDGNHPVAYESLDYLEAHANRTGIAGRGKSRTGSRSKAA